MTPVATRRAVVLGSNAITGGTTVANTTTETQLATSTIAANEMAVGKVFLFRIAGRYSTANGTDTVDIRFRLNSAGGTHLGTLVVTSTAAAVTNAPFALELLLTCRTTGGSGTVWVNINGHLNNVSKAATATAVTTVDTTVAENILATADWSAADAGNTITCEQVALNLLT